MEFICITVTAFLKTLLDIFPVDGRAQLILMEHLHLWMPPANLVYQIAMETGLLLAVAIYFSKDIAQMVWESPALLRYPFTEDKRTFFSGCQYALTLSMLLTASGVTWVVHFLLQDTGRSLSHFWPAIGMIWILFGVYMVVVPARIQGRTAYEMNQQDSFLIGLAQGMSVLAGIPRAGIATVTCMQLGFSAKESLRFSYLLTIPYLLASVAWRLREPVPLYETNLWHLSAALIVSFFTGLGALALMSRIILRGKFGWFGIYLIVIGIATVLFWGTRIISL